jgi:hypothetical protein
MSFEQRFFQVGKGLGRKSDDLGVLHVIKEQRWQPLTADDG